MFQHFFWLFDLHIHGIDIEEIRFGARVDRSSYDFIVKRLFLQPENFANFLFHLLSGVVRTEFQFADPKYGSCCMVHRFYLAICYCLEPSRISFSMIPFLFFPVNPFKNTKREITFSSKTEHRNATFFAYRIVCIERLMRMTDKKGLE